MKKAHLLIIITILIASFNYCNQEKKIKTHTIYKINYSYQNDSIDSTKTIKERYCYDRDSNIIAYYNYTGGYFYTSTYNKSNSHVTDSFYTIDTTFLYINKSIKNKDGLITEIHSYDSLNNLISSIFNKYNDKNLIKERIHRFNDSSIAKYIFIYDKYDNLINKTKIENNQAKIIESHKLVYDKQKRIIRDTILSRNNKKIIEKKYRYNKIFYETLREEEITENGKFIIKYEDSLYTKTYYIYDKNGKIIQKRHINLVPTIKLFYIDYIEEFQYFNSLICMKNIYNSKEKKLISYINEYEFY